MATYTSRFITFAVLAIALGNPAQPSTATTELPAPVFASEQDAAAYAWTQDLFAATGFEQPAATIEFFDSEEGCGGARGRAWLDDTGTATIAVCATHANPEVETTWRQRTLLHEIAHAWVDQNVSAERKAAFTELQALEAWSSRDVKWEDRATEHAAEIFMWGIQGGNYNVDFRIAKASCVELAAGYELLTGISVECDAQVLVDGGPSTTGSDPTSIAPPVAGAWSAAADQASVRPLVVLGAPMSGKAASTTLSKASLIPTWRCPRWRSPSTKAGLDARATPGCFASSAALRT